MKNTGTSELYFEAHVTIDPVFEQDRVVCSIIAGILDFKLAKLLMQKRKEDSPEQSKYDTFMTSHDQNYASLEARMVQLIQALQSRNYIVRRYKIEDTIIDSRAHDNLNLLTNAKIPLDNP